MASSTDQQSNASIQGPNIQIDANGKQTNPNILTSLTTAPGTTTTWQNYISSNSSTPANSSITTEFTSPNGSQPSILKQTTRNSGPLIGIDSTDPLLPPGYNYRLAGWYATTEGYQSSDAMFNAVYDLEHNVDDPTLFPIKSINSAASLTINEDFPYRQNITSIKLVERVYTGEANYPATEGYEGPSMGTNTTQWNETAIWIWPPSGVTEAEETIPLQNVALNGTKDVLVKTQFSDENGTTYQSEQIWNAQSVNGPPLSSQTYLTTSIKQEDQAIQSIKRWIGQYDIIRVNPGLQGLSFDDQPILQINVYEKSPATSDWGTPIRNLSQGEIYDNGSPEIDLAPGTIDFVNSDLKLEAYYVGADGLNYKSTAYYNAGAGTDLRGGNDYVTPDASYTVRDLKLGSNLGGLLDHKQIEQDGETIWWEKRYVDFTLPDEKGKFNWNIGNGALSPNSQSTEQIGSRLYAGLELEQWNSNFLPQNLPVISIDNNTVNAEEGGEPGRFTINIAKNAAEFEAQKDPSKYSGADRHLYIRYEISDSSTATRNVDYYSPFTTMATGCNPENIIFAKLGSKSVDVYIPAVEDAIAEGNEDVEIRLMLDGYNFTSGCNEEVQNKVQPNLFLGPSYTINNSNASLNITDRKADSPKNLFAKNFNPINLFEGLDLSNSAQPVSNAVYSSNGFSSTGLSSGNTITTITNPSQAQSVLKQSPVPNQSSLQTEPYSITLTSELIAGKKYILSGWYARSTDYQESDKMFYAQIDGEIVSGAGIGKLVESKIIDGITWEKRYQEITIPDTYTESSTFIWMVGQSEAQTYSSPMEAKYASQAAGSRYYADLRIQEAGPTALQEESQITTVSLSPFGDSVINGTTTQDESIIDSPAGGVPLKMTTKASDDNSPAETYTQTFGLSSSELEDRQVWNIAEVNQGETYTFSVWAKADKKNTAASITILEANDQGEALISTNFPDDIKSDDSTNTNIKDKSIKLSTRWRRFSVTKTIENDLSKNIQVKLSGPSSNESRSLWWDGIQVEKNIAPTNFIDHQSIYPFLPGISITPANRKGITPVRAQTTTNNKETASFNVYIDSQPRQPVTVTLNAAFINESASKTPVTNANIGTIVDSDNKQTSTLTFTADNWERPQQVSLINIQQNPDHLQEIQLTATTDSQDHFYSSQSDLKANQLIYPSKSLDLRNVSLWEGAPQNSSPPEAFVNEISGEEGQMVGFRFSLSKPNKTDTKINFDLNASAGFEATGSSADIQDKKLPSSIIIPAKKRSVILDFNSIDDDLAEGIEFINIALEKPDKSGYYIIGEEYNNAKAIINDNDTPGIEFVVQRTVKTEQSVDDNGAKSDANENDKQIWVPISQINLAKDACQPNQYTFGVRLTSEIRDTVVIYPSKNGIANVTFDQTPLTFNTTSKPWDQPQKIELTFDSSQSISEGNLDAIIFETASNQQEPFYSQLEADLPIFFVEDDTPITTLADETGESEGVEIQDPNTPIAILEQDETLTISEPASKGGSQNSSTFTVRLKKEPYTSTDWEDFTAEEETVIFFEPEQQMAQSQYWPLSYDIKIPSGNYLSGLQRYINDGNNQQAATPTNLSGNDTLSLNSNGSTDNPFIISDLKSLAGSQNIVSWGGYLYIPESGNYDFKLTVTGGASLTVGNHVMIDQIDANVDTTLVNTIPFDGVAGEFVPFKLEYNPNGNQSPQVDLEWIRPINLNTDTNEEKIPSQYLSRIGAWHVVIPKGESSANFSVSAKDDDLAKPQQQVNFKLLRNRSELLDVSLEETSNIDDQSLTIQLDENSTRESLVLSPNTANNVVDADTKSTTTSTPEPENDPSSNSSTADINENSLTLDLSSLDNTTENPEDIVTIDLSKSPSTIYKGASVSFNDVLNYKGGSDVSLNATSPQQYQLIDDAIDIKLTQDLVAKNPLLITLGDIKLASTPGSYTGTLTRNDQFSETVTLLKNQKITLISPDSTSGDDQVVVEIQLIDDIELTTGVNNPALVNFTIVSGQENIADINDLKVEASFKTYEAFFEIGSTNRPNGTLPKGSNLIFNQEEAAQACEEDSKSQVDPFPLVLVRDLGEGSKMVEAGTPVIDLSETQSDLSQKVSNQTIVPVAHYQFPETEDTSTRANLKIDDNEVASIEYSQLVNGSHAAIDSSTQIQLQENGEFQTLYVNLKSQPTQGVTIYLETNDPTEVSLQKDYDFIEDVSITINTSNKRLKTVKPPKASNEDFLRQAILKMDSNPRIKAFTVEYANNDPNSRIEKIQYITTKKYTATKAAEGSSNSVRLFADPTSLQSVRSDLNLTIEERQFSPESLIAFTFTPDNWETPQPFTLKPMDDVIDDDVQTANIFQRVSSQDSKYQSLTGQSDGKDNHLVLSIDNNDDDTASVLINAISPLQESSSTEIGLSLSTKPTDNVTLTLTPSDNQFKIGQNALRQAEFLTFTPDNYNVKQAIELQAIDDTNVEDITLSNLLIESKSADPNFDKEYLVIDPVIVEIIDNDVPTASIEFVNDGTENAEPGKFRVKLSNPADSSAGSNGVVIKYKVELLNQGDASSPTSSLSKLQFPDVEGSIRVPPGQIHSETFVVPIDDMVDSPDASYKISLEADDSTTPKYVLGSGEKAVQNSATVKIINNDIAGFTLIHQGDVIHAEENGDDAQFFLILNSQPLEDVSITLSEKQLPHNSENIQQLTDETTTGAFTVPLTFTPFNWFIPQAVRVTAKQDYVLEDGELINGGLDNEQLKLVTYDASGNVITDVNSTTGAIQHDGIHPAAIQFEFNSCDSKYNSGELASTCAQQAAETTTATSASTDTDPASESSTADVSGDEASSFVNHAETIRILDEALPEQAKGVINTSFISLQDAVNHVRLPMIGQSDLKTGDNISSLIHGLTDELSHLRSITPAAIQELLTQQLVQHLGMTEPATPEQQLVNVKLDETSATKNIDVVLKLDTVQTGFEIPLDADLGNSALGIHSQGSLNTNLNIDGKLSFVLPLEGGTLPYLKTGQSTVEGVEEKDTYLQAQIISALSDDFKLTGGLGFLEIEGSNAPTTRFSDKTEIDITLSAFPNPSNSQLGLADVLSAINNPQNLTDLLSFEISDDSKAQFSLDVRTSVNGSSAMPSFGFNMASTFPFKEAEGDQILYIDDVNLDLGSFVTGIAGPSVSQVDSILKPIYPVLDALYADTHLFGKIGLTGFFDQNNDNQVSMMDLVEWFTKLSPSAQSSRVKKLEQAREFIDNVNNVATVIREIEALRSAGGNYAIEFPSYEFNSSGFNPDGEDEASKPITREKEPAKPTTSPIDKAKDTKDSTNKYSQVMNKLTDMGITIPLLDEDEYMQTVSNLITGDTADLMKWTLSSSDPSIPSAKSLNVESSISKSFPIWGPISGLIEGGFNATTDLSFGFDTTGMQQWQNDNFQPASAWKVFNGFYVDDEQDGSDIDEFNLDANMGAGAGLSAFVARASITGGLEADAGLDLLDVGEISNTSDGKIYADEIISRIDNPLSLFDIVGELAAYLEAKVQVGIDAWLFSYWKTVWEKRLATIPIFRFGIGGSYGSGTVSNGHLDGSTVFFDSNFNGRIDQLEPQIKTNESSKHSLFIDHRKFDKDFDGSISDHEGRLIAIGGTDTTTNLDVLIPMVGSIDSKMITPLTTLHTMARENGASEGQISKKLDALFGLGNFDFHNKDALRILNNAKSISKAKYDNAVSTYLAHNKIHFTLDVLASSINQLSDEFLGSTKDQLNMINAFAESLVDQPAQSPFSNSVRIAIIETLEKVFKQPINDLADDLVEAAMFAGEAAVEFAEKLDALEDEQSLTLKQIHQLKTDAFSHYRENLLGLSDGLHKINASKSRLKTVERRLSQAHADFVEVTASNQFVLGTSRHNDLSGGSGEDVLSGMGGSDSLSGGAGRDHLKGGKGNDEVKGGQHQDVLEGDAGADLLLGGRGNDELLGGKGADRLRGMSGNDHLVGGHHNDHLSGESGDDSLEGFKGNDTLIGGSGDDLLTGGAGKDLFILSKGEDTITDFKLRKGRGDKLTVKTDLPLNLIQNGNDLTIETEDGIETTLLSMNREAFLKFSPIV